MTLDGTHFLQSNKLLLMRFNVNLLYAAALPLFYLAYQMNMNFTKSTVQFFGFAENKETELSHDQPVLISSIKVMPGQAVRKGDVLIEMERHTIDVKIHSATQDKALIGAQRATERTHLRRRIEQLQAQKATKKAAIQAKINELQATIAFNQGLLSELKSIQGADVKSQSDPNVVKIEALKAQLATEVHPIDVQIAQLQTELAENKLADQINKQKIDHAIDYLKDEQERLLVRAPADGIVGNILCKEGENISAFQPLINFYEPNPTVVRGYVHESAILRIREGDSMVVNSSLNAEYRVSGKIIGLGSRIVEIPERLRKVPEIKTYGREVLISIPNRNPFLQKEKVMLHAITEDAEMLFSSVANMIFSSRELTHNSSGTVINK